jgi:hypothetical protein
LPRQTHPGRPGAKNWPLKQLAWTPNSPPPTSNFLPPKKRRWSGTTNFAS